MSSSDNETPEFVYSDYIDTNSSDSSDNNISYEDIWNKLLTLIDTCSNNLNSENINNLIDCVQKYSNEISTRIIYYKPYIYILENAVKNNIIEFNYYYKNIDNIYNQITCDLCYKNNNNYCEKIKSTGYHCLTYPYYDLCKNCYFKNNNNLKLPFIELDY